VVVRKAAGEPGRGGDVLISSIEWYGDIRSAIPEKSSSVGFALSNIP
jgi:hypothetical protein